LGGKTPKKGISPLPKQEPSKRERKRGPAVPHGIVGWGRSKWARGEPKSNLKCSQ